MTSVLRRKRGRSNVGATEEKPLRRSVRIREGTRGGLGLKSQSEHDLEAHLTATTSNDRVSSHLKSAGLLHSPLGLEEIRLMRIDNVAGELQDSFEISLVHCDLRSPPEYTALSYAWGNVRIPDLVFTSAGQYVQISANLWHFFRARYPSLSGQLLWIDQICINQSDNHEKGQQIRLMSRIYENASRTLLWLGQADECSEHAFHFLEQLAATSQDVTTTLDYPLRLLSSTDKWDRLNEARPGLSLPPFDENIRNSLNVLFSRSWFTRLWPLQEVVLSKTPVFMSGKSSCSWETFTNGCIILADIFDLEISETMVFMQRSKDRHGTSDQSSFLELLIYANLRLECSDNKDKVFALLGLQSWLPESFVDYWLKYGPDSSPQFIYISVAEAFVMTSGTLDVLGAVQTDETDRLAGLPSWVPDWTKNGRPDLFPAASGFNACGCFAFVRRFEMSPTGVEVKGRIIDSIAAVDRVLKGSWGKPDFMHCLEYTKKLPNIEEDRKAMQTYLLALSEDVNHHTDQDASSADCRGLVIRTLTAARTGLSFPDIEMITDEEAQDIWDFLTDLDARPPPLNKTDEARFKVLCSDINFTGGSRTTIWLKDRSLAIGPTYSEPGDSICILHGSTVPIVLRPQGAGEPAEPDLARESPVRFVTRISENCSDQLPGWIVVGQCYVDGIMFGEAVTWPKEEASSFNLV